MISVKSYIKNDKIITSLENIETEYYKYFVEVNNKKCLELISDFDYIEGAIVFNYYGNTILGFKQWDLIDQLWVYFINAIEELIENKKVTTFYFPDQPIEVQIAIISQKQALLSIAEKKYYINKNELLIQLLKGAEDFFEILKECPIKHVKEQSYGELKRIKKLKNKFNTELITF